MSLLDTLTEDVVKVPLESTDKEEAIRELIEVLFRAGRIENRDAALEAVESRESQFSTGIGNGLGVPHGKAPGIKQVCVAAGTCPEGMDFDSIDDQPVYMIFLILSEPDNPGPHIRCLAEVAGLMNSPGMAQRLSAATDSKDLVQRLLVESEKLADSP